MAERRMFAKTIIDSDAFLEMPISARLLYYDLSMRADDDGFVNSPKKIMRFIGATNDDMNILIARKFVIAFDNGIVVIKHWRIHNYIQKDRYVETKYKEEKSLLSLDENNSYTLSNGKPLIDNSRKELTEAQRKRYEAKKESDLPYSFEYKIRQAFVGKNCPICNCIMDYSNNLTKPTIQHNVPISKGGKHELDNISVICASCNSSIVNHQITPELNNEEVKKVWYEIGNVSGMDTQDRLGKVSIGKVSIDEVEDIFGYYQNEIGSLSPKQYEKLQNYLDKLSGELIIYAIDKTRDSGANSFRYLEAILKEWIQKEYTTLDQAKNEIKPSKKNKTIIDTPDWLNKEIEKEKSLITDEERKEFGII